MGTWGADIMQGDSPLDIRDDILHNLDIDFDHYLRDPQYFNPVFEFSGLTMERIMLEKISEWKVCEDKQTREVLEAKYESLGYLVLGFLVLTHKVKIGRELMKRIIRYSSLDQWAKTDLERKQYVKKLIYKLQAYKNNQL